MRLLKLFVSNILVKNEINSIFCLDRDSPQPVLWHEESPLVIRDRVVKAWVRGEGQGELEGESIQIIR